MAFTYSSVTSRLATVALFASFALSPHATAQQGAPDQQQAQASDQPDPEDRNHGVARISLMNGDVSVRRGDSGDFVAAQINAPLLAADSVQTGLASRAEVQFDYANRIRISSGAEVRMGDLRDGAFQVQIARGVTTFTMLRESAAQIEISTPSASVRPLHRGDYRVAVLDDGTTQITVRSGGAEIYTPQGSQRISMGQTMLVRGSANDPEYQVVAGIARDDWDTFNERRDREMENSTAYQHVSTDIQGAEDLDNYGRWQQDPNYGQVWTPNVAADWAPYQAGRWVWGDYYGWTWVSTDPWGWAPYHYGNWFYGNAGWSWYPGPYRSRYWYRPAVVGFFGFGAGVGFGFGFGFGNLGWCALAPFERYNPWWGHGYGRGFTNVNIVNNVNVYNNYRNARVTNGVSSVTAQQFQSGQYGRVSHPSTGQIQNAGMVRGQLPVTPGAANLRFNDRQTNVTSRMNNTQQQFVSRGGFNAPQRTSFEQQRQNLQSSFSSPRSVQQVGGQGAQGQGQGGRSFASPNTQAPTRQSPTAAGSSSWQRFGNPNGSRSAQAPTRSGESSFGNPSGSRFAPAPSRSVEPNNSSNPGNLNNSRSTQPSARSAEPNSGWGRFGSPTQSNQVQMIRPSPGSFGQTGSQATPQPRSFAGGGTGYSSGRSVQIAPPIVQQRTQQSSPSGNQGNYRQSMPSARQSAPPPNTRQSAPAPAARQSSGGGARSGGGGHR